MAKRFKKYKKHLNNLKIFLSTGLNWLKRAVKRIAALKKEKIVLHIVEVRAETVPTQLGQVFKDKNVLLVPNKELKKTVIHKKIKI